MEITMKNLKQIWLFWRTRRLQMADEKTRMGLEKWVKDEGYAKPNESLEEVAKEIGVSSLQLSYYFRVIVGKPFLTWRKEQRILGSETLLVMYPEKSIASIGEAVGIPDKSNFKKQFRSVAKMSPRKFRETYSPIYSRISRSR